MINRPVPLTTNEQVAHWLSVIRREVQHSRERPPTPEDQADATMDVLCKALHAAHAGDVIDEQWLTETTRRTLDADGRRARRRRALERRFGPARELDVQHANTNEGEQVADHELLSAVLEFCRNHPDGSAYLAARLDRKSMSTIAANAGMSERQLRRRLKSFHELILKRFQRTKLAIAIWLSSYFPESDVALWDPPLATGVKIVGALTVVGIASFVLIGSGVADAEAPPRTAATLAPEGVNEPRSPLSERARVDVPGDRDRPAPATSSRAPGAVRAARVMLPRPSRSLLVGEGDLVALCHPRFMSDEPMSRRALALQLMTWWPPTAGEIDRLAALQEQGTPLGYTDVELPSREGRSVREVLANPTTEDCDTLDQAAIIVGSLRTTFRGQDGGCFLRETACEFAPDATVNAAELVTLLCRALLVTSVDGRWGATDECQPSTAPVVQGLDASEWHADAWYGRPMRVLLAELPEVDAALRAWFVANSPGTPLDYSKGEELLSLLPRSTP